MEEINEILQNANILFECENKWKQMMKQSKLFSAFNRKEEYRKIIIIDEKIKQIISSGRCDYYYKSVDEEIADLQIALELLKQNAADLYDSDRD